MGCDSEPVLDSAKHCFCSWSLLASSLGLSQYLLDHDGNRQCNNPPPVNLEEEAERIIKEKKIKKNFCGLIK